MTRNRMGALLLGGALLVVACGGGGSATQAPQGTQPPAGATQPPAATQGANPTIVIPDITIGPAPTGGGGGGTASTACDLITGDEVGSTLGTGSTTATAGAIAGQTFCDYRTADGAAVMTSYMQASGAGAMWGIWKSSLTTEPVSGLGDEAMFEPSTKLLFVLKGDAFFNVFVADIDLSPAEALAKEQQLAEIMVARL